MKQLRLEIIEKIWCSMSVRPSTATYITYIKRTDFEHHFPQLFRVRVVLSRWTYFKKKSKARGINPILKTSPQDEIMKEVSMHEKPVP